MDHGLSTVTLKNRHRASVGHAHAAQSPSVFSLIGISYSVDAMVPIASKRLCYIHSDSIETIASTARTDLFICL